MSDRRNLLLTEKYLYVTSGRDIHRKMARYLFAMSWCVAACQFFAIVTANADALSPIVVSRDLRGFADPKSNTSFVLRGVNYFHLNKSGPYDSFDTFDPEAYRSEQIARDLDDIRRSGYNVVRTFLTGYLADRGFDRANPGLPSAYVANITDFLRQARARGMRVVLTGYFGRSQDVPGNFLAKDQSKSSPNVGEKNRMLLDPRYAFAMASLYEHLLTGIAERDETALAAIFGIDLYNELHLDAASAPLNCLCGRYEFDGRSFDLSRMEERQALADHAAFRWVRIVRHAVKTSAPHVLTTVSIFPNTVFGRTGFDGVTISHAGVASSPYPLRPRALISGGVDYIDVHLYVYPAQNVNYPPAMHADLNRISASLELEASPRLPLVVGEFGAYRALYPTPEAAVPELLATLKASCRLGVAGWIFWMWNGPGDTWTLTDDGKRIDRALSPQVLKEPCSVR